MGCRGIPATQKLFFRRKIVVVCYNYLQANGYNTLSAVSKKGAYSLLCFLVVKTKPHSNFSLSTSHRLCGFIFAAGDSGILLAAFRIKHIFFGVSNSLNFHLCCKYVVSLCGLTYSFHMIYLDFIA